MKHKSSKKKSKSPEKRSDTRKKSRFAPPEAAPEILAAMGLSSLPPTVAAGLAAQGITSLPLVGTGGVGAAASAPTTQLKSQLELFIGNTPPTCTQQGLVDFINAAMRQVNRVKGKCIHCSALYVVVLIIWYGVFIIIWPICLFFIPTGESDAVTGARLSNKFAFVTFR